MKQLTVRVTTEMTYTTPAGIPITDAQLEQIAAAFETGWRVGALKDFSVIQAVYRQQFGLAVVPGEPKMTFEHDIKG